MRRQLRDDGGQSLVEFSLLLPVFLLLALGLVEFAFVLYTRNTVEFASRDASMLAAEGGRTPGADCVVLLSIENNITAPASPLRVLQVQIYWSDANGNAIGSAANVYDRSGSTTCAFGDGTSVTVPYTLSSAGYPESDRCDVLAGCGGSHTTVDMIGVQITYEHRWVASFTRMVGSGVTFQISIATRMEPVL